MPISEQDISIVIPTYRYRDKVVRAVESALASGAGEIIVVDDCSNDGTLERLSTYSDPRLIVRENKVNLGLWENHLTALKLASKAWIKFIQADDYLLPGGLAAYAAAVEDGVTVVFGVPTFINDLSGDTSLMYQLDRARRVNWQEILAVMPFVGWLLGTPSHMMLRSDVIERAPEVWRTTISTDMIIGSIAAAKGDTVLIPAGAIGQGTHSLQDAKTQNAILGLRRHVESLEYIRQRPEPGLRRIANQWAVLGLMPVVRTAARGFLFGEGKYSSLSLYLSRSLADLSVADWRQIVVDRRVIRSAYRYRRERELPIDLDRLFDGNLKT